ncbi:MAG: hypothetical protein K2H30_04315 [Clostridia bacterium]|nr:hypothetical protein [Clostridia bacterium]
MDNSYLAKPAKTLITLLAGVSGVSLSANVILQEDHSSSASNEQYKYHRYLSDTTPSTDYLDSEIMLDCDSTYNNITKRIAMFSTNPELQLINLLKVDNDEENYFPSIEYINKESLKNESECIAVITAAFRFNNYDYAEKVLGSVMFSDINYLASWFKSLLLECKNIPHLRTYAEDIYAMYKEVFDKL